MRAEDIAEAEGIPTSFLAQILSELKRNDFVTSRRGKTGGWRLQREPAEISFLQVVEALEPALLSEQEKCGGRFSAATGEVWDSTREGTRRTLQAATLDVVGKTGEPMYFI